MSQAGIEMQSVAAPHSSNSVTNHRVHDLQILNCPSPPGNCGVSASACADILCVSRSSAPAHQQEGKAGVAMPALPFYAQVARLARQV